MKKISVRNGKFVLVDDEDFEYLNQWKWQLTNSGYSCRAKSTGEPYKLNGKTRYHYRTLYMHREILNPQENQEIDHINREKKSRISQYKGVGKDLRMKIKQWHAYITIDGHNRSLGYFLTEVEAAKAYNERAKELHGEFARLNHGV